MITLKERSLDDAERFWNILTSDKFKWFGNPPADVEGERAFIAKEMENKHLMNFTIMYNDEIVGGIGVKFNPHRDWIAEVGYFVDSKYWKKGIGSKALLMCIGRIPNSVKRVELVIDPENVASISLALKAGFYYEATFHRKIRVNGELRDGSVYAKLVN